MSESGSPVESDGWYWPKATRPSGASTQLDEIVPWWTQTESAKNFGDKIAALILERALIAPLFRAERYHLLGSVLDDQLIAHDLASIPADGLLAFWGCGARSADGIADGLRRRSAIFGARGPRTREALGLPANTPLGDPGFLVPLLYSPRPDPRTQGRSLCIPHFMDPTPLETTVQATGVDIGLWPRVRDMSEQLALIDAIASADFVLTGSLHVAIVACGFGRPFAFLQRGFVDTPFKWQDLADLLAMDLHFASDLAEARKQFQRSSAAFRRPPLVPLLACCPWAIRSSLLLAALAHDAGLDGGRPASLKDLDRSIRSFEEQQEDLIALTRASIIRERDRHNDAAGVALRQLRGNLASHADSLQRATTQMAHALSAQAAAMTYRFFDESGNSAPLDFSEGRAGAAMLIGDWAPSNDVGPVSIGRWTQFHLGDTTEWYRAERLLLEALIFAPHVPPFDGRRRLRIYLNGALALEQIVVNSELEESVATQLEVEIAPALRKRRGPLRLEFQFDVFAAPSEIGLRSDSRLIGLIPLRMWAVESVTGE